MVRAIAVLRVGLLRAWDGPSGVRSNRGHLATGSRPELELHNDVRPALVHALHCDDTGSGLAERAGQVERVVRKAAERAVAPEDRRLPAPRPKVDELRSHRPFEQKTQRSAPWKRTEWLGCRQLTTPSMYSLYAESIGSWFLAVMKACALCTPAAGCLLDSVGDPCEREKTAKAHAVRSKSGEWHLSCHLLPAGTVISFRKYAKVEFAMSDLLVAAKPAEGSAVTKLAGADGVLSHGLPPLLAVHVVTVHLKGVAASSGVVPAYST